MTIAKKLVAEVRKAAELSKAVKIAVRQEVRP